MQEINFDIFKDDIQEIVQQQGFSNDEVVAALARKGFQTSTRSLKRRLASWNIRRERLAGEVSDALAEAVNYLFHHTLLNDAEIATRIINDYSLQTSHRQVRSIRSLFGWRRATHSPARATQQTSTSLHIQQALLNGVGRTFSRRWFMTYLRQQFGYKARRNDLAAAQKQLDPASVASRLPGLRRARLENYTTSGPNFLWCLDGHDKLAQYRIEIYAAVDAYSRKIVWFYCGNSNRTQISVLKQYLNAVKAVGLCPRFIRTDKGTETVLLANCHFSLFIEAALREQWSEAEYKAVRISDCYIYGPSTRNIRVKGLWRQQRCQATGPWLAYFNASNKPIYTASAN
jgi:SOS response regulatory protein OraA/RecX